MKNHENEFEDLYTRVINNDQSLKTIHLGYFGCVNNVGRARYLVEALKSNQVVTSIIGYSQIKDRVVVDDVESILKRNQQMVRQKKFKNIIDRIGNNERSLKQISLRGCEIGDKEYYLLEEVLQKNFHVIDIDFQNKIKDEGVKSVIGSIIQRNQQLEKQEQQLRNQRKFRNIVNSLRKEDMSLVEINLRKLEIGDEEVKLIAVLLENNQTVKKINFAGNQIGIEGLNAISTILKNNQTITNVIFDRNQINDEEIKIDIKSSLQKNQQLEKKRQFEEIIIRIKNNDPSLKEINFVNKCIGVNGVLALSEALENNQVVSHVNLFGNQIGDQGLKVLASALEKNRTITSIDLRSNKIGVVGAQTLVETLEKNLVITDIDLGLNEDRCTVWDISKSVDFNSINIISNEKLIKDIKSLLVRNLKKSQKSTTTSVTSISGSSITQTQTPSEIEFVTPPQDSPEIKVELKSESENVDLVVQQVLHQESAVFPDVKENKSYQIIGEPKTESEIEKTFLDIIQNVASRNGMNLEQLKWVISVSKDNGGITHLGQAAFEALPTNNFECKFYQAKNFSRNFQRDCQINGIVSVNSENMGMRLHKLPENITKKLDDLEVDDRGYIKKIEAQEVTSSATRQPSTILEPQVELREQQNLRQKSDLENHLESLSPSESEFVTPPQDSPKTKAELKSESENGDLMAEQVLNQIQTPQISLAEFQSNKAQTQALEKKFAAIHEAYSSSIQRLDRIDAEQLKISQLPVAQASTDNLTVDPKFKLSPEAIAEKIHIANNPSLKSYRDKLEKTFNEVFLTAAMMSAGEFSAKSSTPAEMIRTFSNFSSGLPFAPIILSCAAAATDGVLQARKEGRLLNVAQLNPSSNPIDAAMFSEEIARRFTITNEAKINPLAQGKNTQELRGISGFLESAKKFAQDQMTNLDSATARGLFGEVQSPVQLLAYKDSQAAVEYVLNGELKNKSGANVMVAEIVEAVTGMKAKSLVPAIPVVAAVVVNEANQGQQSSQLRKRIISQKPNVTYQLPVQQLPVAVALPTPPVPNPIVKGASNLYSGEEIDRKMVEMQKSFEKQLNNQSQSQSQFKEETYRKMEALQEAARLKEIEQQKEIEKLRQENAELRATSANSEKRSLAADRKAEQAEKRSLAAKQEAAQAVKKMDAIFQSKFVGEGDQVKEIFTTKKDVTIRVVNPEMEERMALIIQQQELDREENNERHDRNESRVESHAEKWKRKEDKKKNSLSGRISGMFK